MNSPDSRYGEHEPIPVLTDDLDTLGIVHHSRYPAMLEQALERFWNCRPATGDAADRCQVIREIVITFDHPIPAGDEVVMHFWIDHVGRTSAGFAFQLSSPDRSRQYTNGRATVVKIDPGTHRPTPWSPSRRAALKSLQVPCLPA